MLKLSHASMTFISGALWMIIGISLLQLGLKLLLDPSLSNGSLPLLGLFRGIIDLNSAAIALVTLALYLGFLKGKYVLSKSANRTINHIRSLPNPAPLHQIYTRSYLLLLGLMVCLGISIKYLGIPNDIRGMVDVAVGAALINGAVHFLRIGFQLRKEARS